MRLNRENTMIENNQYPLAGLHPEDVQKKLVEYCRPIERDILQIEAALLLHNIPLLVAFGGFLLAFVIVSGLLIADGFPSLAYGIIFVPLFHLFWCAGGVEFGRKLYLKELPEARGEDDPQRVRSLEELMQWFWFPMLWGWRVAFFVYRTFVLPNIVDTAAFIIIVTILGLLCKAINVFVLLGLLIVAGLAAPAVLALTPAGEKVKQFLEDRKKKQD